MEGIQLPVQPHICPGAIPVTFLQECIAFANDWIPALPLPYRCKGNKVEQGYSAVTEGGNAITRVGGILSAQVGLLAKMLLLDQLQPKALGKQGNALYHYLSDLPSQEGWSLPLQLSTETFPVLLIVKLS